MTLKHQYSAGGSHRIVELDIAGFLKTSTEWVSYNNIAKFTVGGIDYVAVTQYFDGTLTPDVIYQLSKTEFSSERIYRGESK